MFSISELEIKTDRISRDNPFPVCIIENGASGIRKKSQNERCKSITDRNRM
jgi:hypothetical protein